MEMNCVSQKAHLMMDDLSVMTASLQAQLKAKMSPALAATLASDDPPPPDEEPPLPPAPEEAPIELGRDDGLCVSVLSQSFCRAARGLPPPPPPPVAAPDAVLVGTNPSNMDDSALRLDRGWITSGV